MQFLRATARTLHIALVCCSCALSPLVGRSATTFSTVPHTISAEAIADDPVLADAASWDYFLSTDLVKVYAYRVLYFTDQGLFYDHSPPFGGDFDPPHPTFVQLVPALEADSWLGVFPSSYYGYVGDLRDSDAFKAYFDLNLRDPIADTRVLPESFGRLTVIDQVVPPTIMGWLYGEDSGGALSVEYFASAGLADPLPADIDGDFYVGADDLAMWSDSFGSVYDSAAQYGRYHPEYDVNSDGRQDLDDAVILGMNYGQSGGFDDGDVNADGRIDVVDLKLFFFDSYGPANRVAWDRADLDANLRVDGSDFLIWQRGNGAGVPDIEALAAASSSTSVPEPTSAWLAWLAAAVLVSRRAFSRAATGNVATAVSSLVFACVAMPSVGVAATLLSSAPHEISAAAIADDPVLAEAVSRDYFVTTDLVEVYAGRYIYFLDGGGEFYEYPPPFGSVTVPPFPPFVELAPALEADTWLDVDNSATPIVVGSTTTEAVLSGPRLRSYGSAWFPAPEPKLAPDPFGRLTVLGSAAPPRMMGWLYGVDSTGASRVEFFASPGIVDPLAGDVDGDFYVGDTDLAGWHAGYGGSYDPAEFSGAYADVNADGKQDFDDLAILLRNFGSMTTLFSDGDIDGNGYVDSDDTKYLMFSLQHEPARRIAWDRADLNSNLQVDGGDFLIWQREYGAGVQGLEALAAADSATSVPEPNSGCLIALASIALLSVQKGRPRHGHSLP